MPFWNFVNNPENDEEVELRIEGDIVCADDAWLYEWFGIPVASKNAFRSELAKHKGKNIVLWIDSDGGDVFAATGMYNALMEHKKDGAKITSKIDGRAMSAATIPPMAADERLVSPGSLCMVHNPLTGVRGYASDLRKTADVLDEVKEAIMNAYQLGTGRSRDEISQMMDNETYMSARTAINEGFATGMLYTDKQPMEPIENVIMFSRQLSIQNSVTDSMKKFFEQYGKGPIPSVTATTPLAVTAITSKTKESENSVEIKDIKNIEELRQHLPELCNQLETAAQTSAQASAQATAQATAQAAERDRIKAIDEISAMIDPSLVAKAKYEEPITAEALAFQALKDNAAKGQTYVATRTAEFTASGAAGVAAGAQSTPEADAQAIEDASINRIAASANQKRKGEGK
ncbi:head maturation protease, ClpP-related [Desulfosporosinus sp. OT]|uniref:head maturation protease, ClpP-related n=1 Tax=Desulfosporosinus sp. OT TaxID=913865 RepID=UPI000223A5DD|nr:head maturation protease, ClpP-related [Desulfosporosinus sp. OT]EGW39170.1 clp protease family protein [Desulfosporosinus sp. OT]